MKFLNFSVLLIVSSVMATGCGQITSNQSFWGPMGTVAGASAGAIAGSVISNGDVLASAGLGAGIGLVSGMAVGYVKDQHEQAALEAKLEDLKDNQRAIDTQQAEIDRMYRQVHDTSQRGVLDPTTKVEIYDGPTLGVYNR